MESFDDFGSLESVSWNCMFGGISSHMAFPVDLGRGAGQYLCGFPEEEPRSVETGAGAGGIRICFVGCRELPREALRKHPGKGESSLSGNFLGCKFQASFLEDQKDQYLL